jgi:hypothetical protein
MARAKTTRGISLVKAPVGLIGLLLLAYGITALIFGDHSFRQHLTSGTIHGKTWLGLEVNGWSGLLFVAAGLLLLLGSPLHWGAKTMSLLVGVVLGAAALVALSRGKGILGLFAANHTTELVWGAAGVLLILLSLLPRVGSKTRAGDDKRAFAGAPSETRSEDEAQPIDRRPTREPASGAGSQAARSDATTPESRVPPTSTTNVQEADPNHGQD